MSQLRNHPVPAYDGPPDYRVIGRNALSPEMGQDEIERINFLAQMNRHLAARVVPGVRVAYDSRVVPAFERAHGRPPTDRTRLARRCSPIPLSRPGRRCGD